MIKRNILEKLRSLKLKLFPEPDSRFIPADIKYSAQESSNIIYNFLMDDSPCMISRFGSTELNTIVSFMEAEKNEHSWLKYILGKEQSWWQTKEACLKLQEYSGFFPADEKHVRKFVELAIKDCQLIDVLGSWVRKENYLSNELRKTQKVFLTHLEPFWCKQPWTRALQGKRVLVVHPFADLILNQYYKHRTDLFENEDILPEFHLETISAVQSLGGENHGFNDWFAALDYMKDEIDKHKYDICLIGCGAYGMSLGAHVKRQGKKSIHIGGSLQLLFGIRGNRWEYPNYGDVWGFPKNSYVNLINQFWIKPESIGRPKNAQNVEGACYW